MKKSRIQNRRIAGAALAALGVVLLAFGFSDPKLSQSRGTPVPFGDKIAGTEEIGKIVDQTEKKFSERVSDFDEIRERVAELGRSSHMIFESESDLHYLAWTDTDLVPSILDRIFAMDLEGYRPATAVQYKVLAEEDLNRLKRATDAVDVSLSETSGGSRYQKVQFIRLVNSIAFQDHRLGAADLKILFGYWKSVNEALTQMLERRKMTSAVAETSIWAKLGLCLGGALITLGSLIAGRPSTLALFLLLGAQLASPVRADAATETPWVTCRKVVISGDPDYPPFSWFDGVRFHGAAFDIVKEALDRIHLPYEVKNLGPFSRVLGAAEYGDLDVIVELKDTPERRGFLSYANTPIFDNPVAVFAKHGRELRYRSWKDLSNLKGGITTGNKFGGGFDEFMSKSLRIEEAPKIEINFNKLGGDRIDYFVNSYYPALSYLIQANREREFNAVEPFITATSNYVGWSKASSCLGRLNDLDTALKEMVSSGMVRKVIEKNLTQFRQRQVQ